MSSDPAVDWLALLFRDHDHLQRVIDKYDTQRFQIRGWSITAVGAVFAVALSSSRPAIASGGVVITVFFWLLEGIIMNIQSHVIDRSNHLERLIEDYRQDPTIQPQYVFGLKEAFGPARFRPGRIVFVMFVRSRYNMTPFYIGMLLVTVVGAIAAAA